MSSLFRLFLSTTNSSIFRANISQTGAITSGIRYLSLDARTFCSEKPVEPVNEDTPTTTTKSDIDRTKIIPLEQSIRYLASEAYKTTYGDKLVWEQYRRNHKGGFAPRRTRKTCVRKGMLSTGNPCPICRDEFLVLDHRNLDLLKQFISPQTGEVMKLYKYPTHFLLTLYFFYAGT